MHNDLFLSLSKYTQYFTHDYSYIHPERIMFAIHSILFLRILLFFHCVEIRTSTEKKINQSMIRDLDVSNGINITTRTSTMFTVKNCCVKEFFSNDTINAACHPLGNHAERHWIF